MTNNRIQRAAEAKRGRRYSSRFLRANLGAPRGLADMSKKLYTAAEVTVMTERLDAEIAMLREGMIAQGDELATAIADLKEAQGKMEAEMRKREAAEKGMDAAEKRALEAVARATAADARADAAERAKPTQKGSNGADVIGAINAIGAKVDAAISASKTAPSQQAPAFVPPPPTSYEIGIQRTADGMLHSLTLTPRMQN